MRFLIDQDVYAITIRFLSGLGHDVVTAAQIGLAQAEDLELLRVAQGQVRIFVTRDRDFGGLVFVRGHRAREAPNPETCTKPGIVSATDSQTLGLTLAASSQDRGSQF